MLGADSVITRGPAARPARDAADAHRFRVIYSQKAQWALGSVGGAQNRGRIANAVSPFARGTRRATRDRPSSLGCGDAVGRNRSPVFRAEREYGDLQAPSPMDF
jgi:hypothetical protein